MSNVKGALAVFITARLLYQQALIQRLMRQKADNRLWLGFACAAIGNSQVKVSTI